jgi:hypothetical protein
MMLFLALVIDIVPSANPVLMPIPMKTGPKFPIPSSVVAFRTEYLSVNIVSARCPFGGLVALPNSACPNRQKVEAALRGARETSCHF